MPSLHLIASLVARQTVRMTLNDAVAAEVRAEMARQRISARRLAEMSGIPHTTLARKMRGAARLDLDDLQDVADALGVDVYALIPPRPVRVAQGDSSSGVVNIRCGSRRHPDVALSTFWADHEPAGTVIQIAALTSRNGDAA